MLFNSFEYLVFFPIIIVVYYLLSSKARWILLLAASYYFYASASGKLLLLILLSTLVDYLVGLKMDGLDSKKEKKPFLIISLVLNLGILCIFKYYNFFNDSFSHLFDLLNLEYLIPALDIVLPVGISFYTLQTLGYSVDIYRGEIKAEKHLGYFALYVCYFPQLVAGPIEKAANLLTQIKKEHQFDTTQVMRGVQLIGFGLFKKVVVADRIYPMIQFVNDNPGDFGGFSVLLFSCLFSYQVYCDFSGYSDIAIGSAQEMGVKLMDNFTRPF
jgi:D-alanyl-lipoteichoic acid acyltransferase DltB (MBOAT superfamily)